MHWGPERLSVAWTEMGALTTIVENESNRSPTSLGNDGQFL